MKHINNNSFVMAALLMVSAIFSACSSEREINTSFSQEDIGQAINNNRWTFSANTASPAYGNFRNLSGGEYFVKCLNDTLIVALPYYGKLNSAAGARDGNPLDFRSTNFTLTKQDKKGGGWLVTINRPDQDVQSMLFTFFDNGAAQANLIMTNRTGINFSGRVTPAK